MGMTGLAGFLLKFAGPLTFVPIIVLTAIYLFDYTAWYVHMS